MSVAPASSVPAGDGNHSSELVSNYRRKSIHKQPPSFFGVVLQALNPNSCIRACHGDVDQVATDEDIALDAVMPDLLDAIENNADEQDQVLALEDMHKLVNKNNAQNRIPIVCTRKWNAIKVLVTYVSKTKNSKGRRQACLVLNNLSIPFDNKAVIILGEHSDLLLSSLLSIIRAGLPEAYLCCVCLMNLSILEDAKKDMLNFVPDRSTTVRGPLENPHSLVSTLESMMSSYRPFLLSDVVSVEGEAIRWAIGMFRNLCTTAENAAMVARTSIPTLVAGFIGTSRHPLCKWKRDSLEDLGLALLVQLVHYPASLKIMRRRHRGLEQSLHKIAGKKGIHGMRALMISTHVVPTN